MKTQVFATGNIRASFEQGERGHRTGGSRVKVAPNLWRRSTGKWTAIIRVSGKQVQRTFNTRREAEQWLAEVKLRKARREPEPALQRLKFEQHARNWLRTYARQEVTASTYSDYESTLRTHLVPELGHLYLDEIRLPALRELFIDWSEGGPRFQARLELARRLERERAAEQGRPPVNIRLGRAPKTLANAMVPLKEMLAHAVQDGLLSYNPAAGLKRPGRKRTIDSPKRVMRVLSREETVRLIEAATPGTERVLLLTAVTTGARMGELRGLRWSDLDLPHRRMRIERSIGREGPQAPKTEKSDRTVTLVPTAVTALREHRLASRSSQDGDLVFASEQGTPLDPANLRRMLRTTLNRAALPPMRFHDLRHCYASLMVAQGAHPKYISDQLGHASIQITMDVYSHLLDDHLNEESDKLEAALFG